MDEVKDYHWDAPASSDGVGHFTAVVWFVACHTRL
jgi:hypothetical protein